MLKLGYKVVSRRWGGLFSAITKGDGLVHYCKYKWTNPRQSDGPLAVYDSANQAGAILFAVYQGEVWICEYEEAIIGDRDGLWFFNRGIKDVAGPMLRYELPPGTVLARRVRLLERISR
jgi:hypothetical protein